MKELCHEVSPDFNDPKIYPNYFGHFYGRLNDTGDKWLHELLVRDVPNIQLRTAGEQFKLIEEQDQRPVFVEYGESKKWLGQLGQKGPTRETMRHLQRYAVNLYKHAFEQAQRDGLISEIWSGYWVWVGKYDEVIGIDLEGG